MSPAVNSSTSTSSSRWCPTPEQLMILEEMYRTGTRTPNASQIQQITAHLSFYGKIEGKNVFYWFQNHKARDRQKLRRKLYKQLQQQQVLFHNNHNHQHMMMMMITNNNNNINHSINNHNNIMGHQNNHHFLGHNSTTSSNISTAVESPFNNIFHHQQHQQQQLSCYNVPSSAGSMSAHVQGTRVFEDHNHAPSSTHNHNHNHHNQMMSYTWKNMEIPSVGGDDQIRQLDQKENSVMMRSKYDPDWMMMLDVGPPPPPNNNNNNNNNNSLPCNTNNKPLKTLQLFPITATNLKEDCTTSSKHDHDHDHDISS